MPRDDGMAENYDLFFMILFNKSSTGSSSKRVCTIKTASFESF